MIFVFGSNLSGRHGKGAALFAIKNHGAKYGQGEGRQGNSYAIPTKDENLKTLDLQVIETFIKRFISYARENTNETFQVTAIGCGLAGYVYNQIAPMFKDVSSNCILCDEFKSVLKEKENETNTLGN